MESNSDSNHSSDHSHSRHHKTHSSGYSHHRHHRQSSNHHRYSRTHRSGKRHERLEDLNRKQRWAKLENFLIKHFLKIIGIIFLLNTVWFAITSFEAVKTYVPVIFDYFLNTLTNLFTSYKSEPSTKSTAIVSGNAQSVSYLLTSLLILIILLFSIRKRNIILSAVSFFVGIILCFWWLVTDIKLPEVTNQFFLVGFIMVNTIFYLSFFLSNLINPYILNKNAKNRIQITIVIFNSIFYLLSMKIVLGNLGINIFYRTAFTVFLAVFQILAIYIGVLKNYKFNRFPFLCSTFIVACFFFTDIFKIGFPVSFFAPFSISLLILTVYTKNKSAVLLSFLSMAVALIAFLYQWIFIYFPVIFVQKEFVTIRLFYTGVISGIFLFTAFAVNNSLLSRIGKSKASPDWLKKSFYRKMVKGAYLIIIYLSSFWVFYYTVERLMSISGITFFIFFAFNCLYFIIMIPILARQHSSFFRMVIIISIISTLIYPVFDFLQGAEIRNLCFGSKSASPVPFFLHYVNIVLLLILFYVLLHYFKRAFARKKLLIKFFWAFLYVMMVLLSISEYNHISSIYAIQNNLNVNEMNIISTRIPYSLILIFSSAVVLLFGFTIKSRFLRISSIIILSCALIKILVYDIFYLDNFQKTLFLFILGVVVLGISFSYKKMKRQFFHADNSKSIRNSSESIKSRSLSNNI